ncbi:unnamed protein product [Urochloa humidicola]
MPVVTLVKPCSFTVLDLPHKIAELRGAASQCKSITWRRSNPENILSFLFSNLHCHHCKLQAQNKISSNGFRLTIG